MEIAKLFRPVDDVFTIYVVEQRFAVGRGYDYLHSFLNTANYVTTDEQIKSTIHCLLDKRSNIKNKR